MPPKKTVYFTIPTTGYRVSNENSLNKDCAVATVPSGDKKCKPVLKDCPLGYKRDDNDKCVRNVKALHTCDGLGFY